MQFTFSSLILVNISIKELVKLWIENQEENPYPIALGDQVPNEEEVSVDGKIFKVSEGFEFEYIVWRLHVITNTNLISF